VPVHDSCLKIIGRMLAVVPQSTAAKKIPSTEAAAAAAL
jgi:hypothetical protein